MKKLLLPLLLVLAAATAKAQDWNIAAYYSFNEGEVAAVAMNKVATIDNFLGVKGLNPNVYGFAGVSTGGATLVGGALTFPFKIGEGLSFEIGPAIDGNIMELKNLRFGIAATVTYSVRF
jgi:hypothetical protein